LRPILSAVDFDASSAQDTLIEAVHFLKTMLRKGKSLSQYPPDTFPTRFIPENTKRYLYRQDSHGRKHFLVDRYEFLVYRSLHNGLLAGDIFCRDSVRFRSFEAWVECEAYRNHNLIDDQKWQEKEKLIDLTGLTILKQPIKEHLAALEQLLEERIAVVNEHISSGENKHLKIKRREQNVHWTLQYPRSSESVNHPLFGVLEQIDISDVMHFVNQQCGFMESFEHVLGRYVKQEMDDHILTACLIAWGTNTGLSKMGDISDLKYHTLSAISDSFIRLETLSEVNDCVCNAIAQLPIFRYYDIGETIHSRLGLSSEAYRNQDGQKFETQIHTVNARHSSKYFGLKKGVVSYTLVANNVPANAKIISANDHESHYVFDILFNNTTDIQPEVHSTDTQGTNEVIFAILHLFGYQFAPRYPPGGRQAARIIGKGKKERYIYIPIELYEAIRREYQGKTWLFESKTGNQLNRNNVGHQLRKAAKRIGITSFHPHMLRHSRATDMLLNKDISLKAVSKFLGHASVATTAQMYIHDEVDYQYLFSRDSI